MSIKTAINALVIILVDRLSLSKSDLAAHGQSETNFDSNLPYAVAYLGNTDEISKIVRSITAQ